MRRYPKAAVICTYCDEVIYTTLEHTSVDCPVCKAPLSVREKGDKELIALYNGKKVSTGKKKSKDKKKKRNNSCSNAREYFGSIKKKFKKGKISRADIISACIAMGINKGTAGTQWSKFKKEHKL